MKLQIVFLLAIFCVSFSAADNQAALGQFPWHTYLWMTNGTEYYYCDGGLIRYNWVLTAAHCIHEATWIYARFGGINIFEGFERYTYVEFPEFKFVPANYDISRPYINDIGLINLYDAGSDLILSPNIGLIPLPNVGDLTGLSSTITGFGSSTTDPTTVLRHITFPVMSDSWCLTRHGWSDANTFCTDTLGDTSPCLEDHGGPLTAVVGGQRVIIGVGSTVNEICAAGHHGVFTRVSGHLAWINNIINNPPAPPPPTTMMPDRLF